MERIETYRATVAPHQCDHLGHMNVQHYFAAVSDGMFALMSHIGLGASQIRERAMSFAVVSAESKFIRELAAGDVVRLLSSVAAIGNKSATFSHHLENVESQGIVFETNFKCVLLDLNERVAREIPDDVRLALERISVSA